MGKRLQYNFYMHQTRVAIELFHHILDYRQSIQVTTDDGDFD